MGLKVHLQRNMRYVDIRRQKGTSIIRKPSYLREIGTVCAKGVFEGMHRSCKTFLICFIWSPGQFGSRISGSFPRLNLSLPHDSMTLAKILKGLAALPWACCPCRPRKGKYAVHHHTMRFDCRCSPHVPNYDPHLFPLL